MSEIGLQNANLVLGDLEEDPDYKALAEAGTNPDFNEFRQQVEVIRARCLAFPFTYGNVHEVRGLLITLYINCRGTLGRFRPFVERALTALDR
jgi:hypothetical protein